MKHERYPSVEQIGVCIDDGISTSSNELFFHIQIRGKMTKDSSV